MAYEPSKALGRRLREAADPLMDDQRRDATGGLSQFQAVYRFDLAHLIMLIESELIPRDVGVQALKFLTEATEEQLATIAQPPAENFFSETLLIRKLGLQDGGWLPLGRSTHDMNGMVWRLRIRRQILDLTDDIVTLRETLLARATDHTGTVMPHFTHRVEGQLATLAHSLHSHVAAFERDTKRFKAAFGTVNTSPAGVAAGVGTPFPLNRTRVADLCGFDDVATNTRDGIWHDGVYETACAQAIFVATLANLGEELFQWQRLGFVEIDDRWCRSSSIMPGKRSVTAIEEFAQLLHSRVNGRHPTSYPVWYWGELLELLEKASWATQALTGVVQSLQFRPKRMATHLQCYWSQAVDIAAYLVRVGLSWRRAHQVTAELVRLLEAADRSPASVNHDDLRTALGHLDATDTSTNPADFAKAVDPVQAIEHYDVAGGIKPDRVRSALAESQARTGTDQGWLKSTNKRLDDAKRDLQGAIDTIVEA